MSGGAAERLAETGAEREWDEAQEVSRIVSHLNRAIGSVRYMAERAARKGYDLDPDEVLSALDVVTATAEDVTNGRAHYDSTQGGHNDRHTLVSEAAERAAVGSVEE